MCAAVNISTPVENLLPAFVMGQACLQLFVALLQLAFLCQAFADKRAAEDLSPAALQPGSATQPEAAASELPLRDEMGSIGTFVSASGFAELSSLIEYSTKPNFPIFAHRDGRRARLALALCHPIFGIFGDMLMSCKQIIVRPDGSRLRVADGKVEKVDQMDAPPSSSELETEVVLLCKAATNFYDRESYRESRASLASSLMRILGQAVQPVPLGGRQGQRGMDLAFTDAKPWKILRIIFEVKNEMYSTNSDPFFEGFLNFNLFLDSPDRLALTANKRCSAFIVALTGPWCCVGAMCMTNGLDFQPLTPFMPLMILDDQNHLQQLMRTFIALRFVAALMASDQPTPLVQDVLVWKGSPLPYSLTGFEIIQKLSQSTQVYLVRIDGTLAVAKLTQRYGWATHLAWAAAGLAPNLQMEHCRELAGGWKLVIMDYLSPEDGWKQLVKLASEPDLMEAVQHSLARTRQLSPVYVHGDLRPYNVFARRMDSGKWEINFIDLDWADKEGLATYPALLNHVGVEWPDGAVANADIRAEHDDIFMAAMTGSATPQQPLPTPSQPQPSQPNPKPRRTRKSAKQAQSCWHGLRHQYTINRPPVCQWVLSARPASMCFY